VTTPLAIEASLRPGVPQQDVDGHPGDRLLYNQSAKRPMSALVGREHSVIADVPYRRGH
jgi:hypothetical protein